MPRNNDDSEFDVVINAQGPDIVNVEDDTPAPSAPRGLRDPDFGKSHFLAQGGTDEEFDRRVREAEQPGSLTPSPRWSHLGDDELHKITEQYIDPREGTDERSRERSRRIRAATQRVFDETRIDDLSETPWLHDTVLRRLHAITQGQSNRGAGTHRFIATNGLVVAQERSTGRTVGRLSWYPNNGDIQGMYEENDSVNMGMTAMGMLDEAWRHAKRTGTAGPTSTTSMTDFSFALKNKLYPEFTEETEDRRRRLTNNAGTFQITSKRGESRLSQLGVVRSLGESLATNLARPQRRQISRDNDPVAVARNIGLNLSSQDSGNPFNEEYAIHDNYSEAPAVVPNSGQVSDTTRRRYAGYISASNNGISTSLENALNGRSAQVGVVETTSEFHPSHPAHFSGCRTCGGNGNVVLSTTLSDEEQSHVEEASASDIRSLLADSDATRTWVTSPHYMERNGSITGVRDSQLARIGQIRVVRHDDARPSSIHLAVPCAGELA